MQVSLFPEVIFNNKLVWSDFTGYDGTTRTELNIKAVAANVSDLSITAPTKTASDISVSAVGAQALAASIIASASIAATLF